MKLQKVPGGWYVEPETSTEQEHLRYLLESLAARPRENAVCATSLAGEMPATHSHSLAQSQSTACVG